MKNVPTTWDEVRFIDGYPGKYALIARRAGDHWFIVGVNADKQPLKTTLDLSLYGKGTDLLLYGDDAQLNGSVKTIKSGKKVTVTIPQNGGLVIVNK